MESIIVFLACICFLFIFGKIFIIPIKWIIKLIFNSILGALLIYAINLVGSIWGFHIGLNFLTAVIVGILGIPGAICLIVIALLIWFCVCYCCFFFKLRGAESASISINIYFTIAMWTDFCSWFYKFFWFCSFA